MTDEKSKIDYDLAFSFASENREYVETVKAECDKLGLVTYYDRERRIDQWGKSFIGEQRKVYGGYRTKHFVPFISKHYFTKPIPTDEFKAALLESTKRSRYILPVKLDDSEVSVDYLHPDTQYLETKDYTPEQLAQAMKKIVSESTDPAKDVDQLLEDELDLPLPKVTPRSYSKYEEAENLLSFIADKFNQNLPKLRKEGYVPVVRKYDNNVRVLVERGGKTLFVLNLFFSSMGDNHIGYNFDSRSMMANASSENGNIEPLFDEKNQKSGYVLMDYSLGANGIMTKEEVVKFFWSKMNEQLEQKADKVSDRDAQPRLAPNVISILITG
ncbi:MAG TPA: TIR domain-containing protein [Candidatus Saccharimonadales bacterium]|nr:TIR domain-containing protein [Candidatus Saccharimonadales bacterium]